MKKMKLTFTFFFVYLAVSALGSPSDHALLLRQRREVDFVGNTQLLVKEFIQNLQKSAQEAIDATVKFNEGLQAQAKLFAEKVFNDLKIFRERVNSAIKSFTDKFSEAGAGVRACVDSFRKEVDVVLGETLEKSKRCTDDNIKEIGQLIEELRVLAINATDFASGAVGELKHCMEGSAGFFATGSCLGGVAVRSEFQGAVFVTQSGLLITRINLALAALPAALEVCAGSHLVAAGMNSAKFVVEIGTCSASSVYTSITGIDLA